MSVICGFFGGCFFTLLALTWGGPIGIEYSHDEPEDEAG